MMSRVVWSDVHSPVIETIGKTFSSTIITTDTYVRISASRDSLDVYFTVDGGEPMPSLSNTFPYRSPFKLTPGSRMIKAVAVCPTTGEISCTSLKSFDVVPAQSSGGSSSSSSSDSEAEAFRAYSYNPRCGQEVEEVDSWFGNELDASHCYKDFHDVHSDRWGHMRNRGDVYPDSYGHEVRRQWSDHSHEHKYSAQGDTSDFYRDHVDRPSKGARKGTANTKVKGRSGFADEYIPHEGNHHKAEYSFGKSLKSVQQNRTSPPPHQRTERRPAEQRTVRPPPQEKAVRPPPQERAVRPPPQERAVRQPPQERAVRPPPQERAVRPPPQERAVRPPPQERYRDGFYDSEYQLRGMHIQNDHGTQINVWGQAAEDALDGSHELVNGAVNSRGDVWGQAADEAFHASHELQYDAPSTSRRVKSNVHKDVFASQPGNVIQAQSEPEQQFSFRKFFSGWGKSSKEEKSDSRKTVNIVGEKGARTYQTIHSECVKKGSLWEDPEFPCKDSSLFYKERPVPGKIEWKRPSEICSSPKMFVKGADRFDIQQGVLGDCWLLAAISTLTTEATLLHKVVPNDQDFSKKYAGVFRFYFWQYGDWVEVVVDDRLPTSDGQLIYMHSTSGNEFWSALLEKAYAKLVGCYENMVGGSQSEALTDLTGGLCETYNFRDDLPSNMFKLLLRAYNNSSLMGCSIDATPDQVEEHLDNGLVIGHAYSVTSVVQLETEDGDRVELIRCRNPWGNEFEWKGAWSDKAKEWEDIADEDQKRLGLVQDHDGEFWISFKDFSANFTRVEICHVKAGDNTQSQCQKICGSWKSKVNAGGCRNHPKTFASNPQYHVEAVDIDEDDEEELCTIVVAIMQKNRRRLRKEGQANLIIGYELFEADGSKPLTEKELNKRGPIASSPTYINQREVAGRHQLEPGHYSIVPTTFEPNQEADFILRVYTEKTPRGLVEVDRDTGLIAPQHASKVKSAQQHRGGHQAETLFTKFGGEDQEIDAFDLQNLLNDTFTKTFSCDPFDEQTCKSLVAMTDGDMTGKLNLGEFKKLWTTLQKWEASFREFDQDHSGKFNCLELRQCLENIGYSLSNATYKAVATRYSDKSGVIDFDNFVALLIKLKTLYDIFLSKQKNDKTEFGKDEFIQMLMYT